MHIQRHQLKTRPGQIIGYRKNGCPIYTIAGGAPVTLDELIERARVERRALLEQRATQTVTIAELRSREIAGDATLEQNAVQAAVDARAATDQAIAASELRIANLEREQLADQRADEDARAATDTQTRRPAYDQVARVGAEERTYRQDTDRKGVGFLNDVVRAHIGNRDSQARLDRHMAEERVERGDQMMERATGTGAFSGLVVPQYLTDMYAPAIAALRPFADEACTHHELPAEGMTVNISKITTASSAALQASENSAVSETDMDDTLLSIPVQTAAGQQSISRQAIERGTGIEDVTMQDLMNRYATVLDSTLLNQASTGLTSVAQVVAYTDASPTVPELYPKILNGVADVEAALLAMGYATHATMHSRRWNWLQSQVSATWPLIAQPSIPTQASGVNNGVGYGKGVRGVLPSGLLVVVDNNIGTAYGAGTNEDEIYVTAENECHLWEDPNAPMLIRAEQPKAASLGILLVVYGYFAYTFSRYANAAAKIGGTGLVPPTF